MNISYIPNYITALRIVGTFGLIFTRPFSVLFYIVYCFTGVTDVLDGFIARKLKVASEFGAKLDSVADVLFNITMIIKIFPALLELLPGFVWYLAGLICVLRAVSYVISAVKFRKIASLHTILNKVSGFLVFTVPFFVYTPIVVVQCVTICILGVIANIEELFIHIRRKEYSTDVKTIIS